MLKRVACVAYCPKSVTQHAQRALDQSHGLIFYYNCLPKYVAKRVLKYILYVHVYICSFIASILCDKCFTRINKLVLYCIALYCVED